MDTSQSAPNLKAAIRKLVILPIGSCEQHGPYLPVDTDLRIAQLLAEKLAQLFLDEEMLLLPALPFSCSWEHKGLGTIALNTATLSAILHDVAYSLGSWNTPIFLVLLNWHGGNGILSSLAAEVTAREGIPTTVIQAISQAGSTWDDNAINDVHAGAIETSIIQAYWPDLVPYPLPKNAHYVPDVTPASTQSALTLGIHAITPKGIWGDPEQSNPEQGKRLISVLAGNIHDQIAKLLELVNTSQL
ncbi:MAG TPA: creatininase family protein [Ktedonobacteraceae bacterium]|nr:creatininase family protein [Ktedonobacteraceae bacterium]